MARRIGHAALRWRGVQSRWVATSAGILHAYDMTGRGRLPTTVLLHGLGSAATPFGPLLARLRAHVRRGLAPDLPGHGFSADVAPPFSADALVDSVTFALDTLLDEPAIVVGNSLGGGVALRYALARPERVRALVLVSPAGAQATDEEWRELKSTFAVGSRAEALSLLRRLHPGASGLMPLIAHELPATLDRPAVRALLASAGNDDVPTPDALGSLAMPILLLWGEHERLLPDSHLEYFARHLPPHAVIERPGFGHCPHLDACDLLADRILAFARRLDT